MRRQSPPGPIFIFTTHKANVLLSVVALVRRRVAAAATKRRASYRATSSTTTLISLTWRLLSCPATILEHYLYRHFDRILAITKPQILELVQRRSLLERHMDEIGLSYIPGSGTFYFFVSIAPSRLDSDEFCTRLLYEHNVCVVPGIGYGKSCDGFVRVSIGAAQLEDIKKGLASIKNLISDTSVLSKQDA